MKIDAIIQETVDTKMVKWENNPKLGWFLDSNPVRIYYGCHLSEAAKLFKYGITTQDCGTNEDYIMCAADPYTAFLHSAGRVPLMERFGSVLGNKDRAVFMVDMPLKCFVRDKIMYPQNDFDKRLEEKELYENWGKSDVEYYALASIYVKDYIPADFVKGYMVRD